MRRVLERALVRDLGLLRRRLLVLGRVVVEGELLRRVGRDGRLRRVVLVVEDDDVLGRRARPRRLRRHRAVTVECP